MTDIETGSHVLCVEDAVHPDIKKLFRHWPVKGEHYVVRDVLIGVHYPRLEGSVRVWLVGMVNDSPNGKKSCERGYDVRRFRNLEQIKSAVKAVEESKKLATVEA